MKTSEIRRALLRRWPATLVVIALAVGLAVVVQKQLKTVPKGTATTQILVDSPNSSLLNVNVNATGLTSQAAVLAQAMTSRAVLADVASSAGVPAGALSAQGPFNGAGEVLDEPTPSEARAMQLVAVHQTYHLAIVAQQTVPIITVTVQGPNPTAAAHIADSVLPGAEKWLASIAATTTLPKSRQLVLRQLGDAQAGEVNSHTSEELAGVAAIAVLILGLLAVALLDRRLSDRRALRRRDGGLDGLAQAGAFERSSAEAGQHHAAGLRHAAAHDDGEAADDDGLDFDPDRDYDERLRDDELDFATDAQGGELAAAGAASAARIAGQMSRNGNGHHEPDDAKSSRKNGKRR